MIGKKLLKCIRYRLSKTVSKRYSISWKQKLIYKARILVNDYCKYFRTCIIPTQYY